MNRLIESYYKDKYKEACWLIGIALMNFTLGFFAMGYWGDVGLGILITLGGIAIYQITSGFWGLFFGLNTEKKKVFNFEQNKIQFISAEIQGIEEEIKILEKYKTHKMVAFLFGLLCVFMAGFGNWNELMLGIGVGLSFQSGIVMILGLLSDYRMTFYLSKLKKWKASN